MKVTYSPGLVDILNAEGDEMGIQTTLQVIRMSNIGDIAPKKCFPFLVYMNRTASRDYCQDWWYFDGDFQCISHKCQVVGNDDEEDRGGSDKDKDISHILQAKAFLNKVLVESSGKLYNRDIYVAPVYKLLRYLADLKQ